MPETTNRPPPPDGLGDGTAVTPTTLGVVVSTLTQEQAADYRHELIHAIYHPGTEFDMAGNQAAVDEKAYWAKVAEVNAYLATFPEKI